MKHNNTPKTTITQIITLLAGGLLFGTIVSQVMNNDFLSERFAILFYFGLIAATLSALTEHHHQKIIQYFTKYIHKLETVTEQKQYRWTYLCYFVFVVVMIQKYGFTDGVAFFTFSMGWLMIYFSPYYIFILSILYTLIMPNLGEPSSTDMQYGIAYFVCGIIATLISQKKSFK